MGKGAAHGRSLWCGRGQLYLPDQEPPARSPRAHSRSVTYSGPAVGDASASRALLLALLRLRWVVDDVLYDATSASASCGSCETQLHTERGVFVPKVSSYGLHAAERVHSLLLKGEIRGMKQRWTVEKGM